MHCKETASCLSLPVVMVLALLLPVLAAATGEFGALKEVLGEFGQRDVVNNLLHKISTLQVITLMQALGFATLGKALLPANAQNRQPTQPMMQGNARDVLCHTVHTQQPFTSGLSECACYTQWTRGAGLQKWSCCSMSLEYWSPCSAIAVCRAPWQRPTPSAGSCTTSWWRSRAT